MDNMKIKKYLVLAGNIGAGKSSLVELLSKRLGYRAYYEPVTENPYLKDFYADMKSWAFHSQLFFLTHRLRSHHGLSQNPSSVVQDRSLYEDAEVFARHLYEEGAISGRDWGTYQNLYHTLVGILPSPDLVVYLRASTETLERRIAKRGRGFESGISADYLEGLNRLYETWIESFTLAPVLIIPADRLDFVEHSADLAAIVKTIEDRLSQKQGTLFPTGM
jgi:deoxyadenosine/deoxycytidine kinase